MILISDIHGCLKTLLALLKQCPDEEVIFLGDLVDRGPNSKGVVQFAIDNKIRTVMGNHDHMMFGAFTDEEIHGNRVRDIWMNNGAEHTISSYETGFKARSFAEVRKLIPDEHIEFLSNLPDYIELPDVLLSHTGNGKYGTDRYEKIWQRQLFPIDSPFRVFGHTPNEEVQIDSISANIDTGCAYKRYGTLSALQWPSMKIFQQQNCE